jgi:molecular chaperone DnaK
MGIAVGIDLGTSNSCVAIMKDGKAVVLEDEDGNRTQPSVVAFGRDGNVIVGHRARRQLVYAPQNTVASAKRMIGRRFASDPVQRLLENTAYGITEGEKGDARIEVGGRTYSLPEISAFILQHMRAIAEKATGEVVDQVVITVPAYFNDSQRQATRDAASIAGLTCLRILNEPTAAALAYGVGKGHRQHIVIYDLGGGTFDVSVLRIEDDLFEVISTAGDTFLGGDDFDHALAMSLLKDFETETGIDLSKNRTVRLKLRTAAEQAKIALSEATEVEINVPALSHDADGKPVDLCKVLSRMDYAKIVLPIVQRTFLTCDDALSQAGKASAQMDHVILVGGMTRYPLIQEAVSQYFGKKSYEGVNPDEVVALGAAIQAWNLTMASPENASILMDVTPQSLGIRTIGGFCETLIGRNSSIPTATSKLFSTAHDNQTEVRIAVFQGEGRMAEENELLGQFVLDDLRPAARGEIKVRIEFEIDADGIVSVIAEDVESATLRSIRIEASSGLSEEEISVMRFDDLGF